MASLLATAAAMVAMAAAYIAYRAARQAAAACEREIVLASSAIESARLAIDRVSSSRASRLAEEEAERLTSYLRSHSSANLTSCFGIKLCRSLNRTSSSYSYSVNSGWVDDIRINPNVKLRGSRFCESHSNAGLDTGKDE